jgi:hypothetical protein
MLTLSQLEAMASGQPNSIEIKQALADSYARQGRWEQAAGAYRDLVLLYPATAVLFAGRLRLGALALMISSALILFAEWIHPPVLPSMEPAAYARAISSADYLAAQWILLVSLALYSCSAITIYKLLSYTRDHRPAFWAMVLSVTGVGLSMSSMGIRAFVFPLLGKLYLEGQTGVLSVSLELGQPPWNVLLNSGGYLLLVGIATFGWVVWRNRILSWWPAPVFLAGWIGLVLSNHQMPKTGLLLAGACIALGGIGFGYSLWQRASVQFSPEADRSAP